ncbi:hypothetical protein [Catellatospora chokoriensis]|uniref:Uncharacterized protein n=1 Tax=Catellatospora chokoriensis TaxID=310353 RepID=A0A8J3NTQ8_9ACTN|nr:hypothetical protein [Catellatospora chokoriensis]GIF90425.1 hypothetical protein Cch02nite_38690 [Catellatospora chokoriensis]
MSFFSRRKAKLPNFAGVLLEDLLVDPTWGEPLAGAGIFPASCDLVRRVDNAMVASPHHSFRGGMPFLSGGPAVVLVQAQRLAIALPDEREVLVLTQPANRGRLMLTRFGAVQIVFGADGSVDGWTFPDMKVGTPDGRDFGNALQQYVVSG